MIFRRLSDLETNRIYFPPENTESMIDHDVLYCVDSPTEKHHIITSLIGEPFCTWCGGLDEPEATRGN